MVYIHRYIFLFPSENKRVWISTVSKTAVISEICHLTILPICYSFNQIIRLFYTPHCFACLTCAEFSKPFFFIYHGYFDALLLWMFVFVAIFGIFVSFLLLLFFLLVNHTAIDSLPCFLIAFPFLNSLSLAILNN